MSGRIDELVTQALEQADTSTVAERLETITGGLRRYLGTSHYQEVERKIQLALRALRKKDSVIRELQDELHDYRHRYHVAVVVAAVTTLCVVVMVAGRPVWAALRHWVGG